MPRYNVEYNGKWACFSSISDGFITEFVDKDSYEAWRKIQYGEYNFKLAEQCNTMTMEEAVFNIRMNRAHEEALECLTECGLTESECEKILCDMEDKHYRPISKGNGKYECPNCRREVDREQRSCEGEDCCLDFVWRE